MPDIWLRITDDEDVTAHWEKPDRSRATLVRIEYDQDRPTIYDESGDEIGVGVG
jgi:hypothetical protein